MSEAESQERAPFTQKDLFVLIWLLTWIACSFILQKKKKKEKENMLLKCLKKKYYCTAVFDMMFALFHILPKINPV